MLKSKGFLFCASVALTSVCANAAYINYETPAQGSDGCYEISTAGELYGFSSIVNGYTTANPFIGCARLTKDIVVNENVLTADGELNSSASSDFATWNPLMRYAGTFDGQGHTISGLYVNRNSGNAGFIGTIEGVAGTPKMVVVKNLGVLDSYFQGSYNNGSIVGIVSYDAWPVLIENCYSNSRVIRKSSSPQSMNHFTVLSFSMVASSAFSTNLTAELSFTLSQTMKSLSFFWFCPPTSPVSLSSQALIA